MVALDRVRAGPEGRVVGGNIEPAASGAEEGMGVSYGCEGDGGADEGGSVEREF